MKLIRLVLGFFILSFDRLFTPQSLQRSLEDQKRVDEQTRSLVLYQLNACPFCVKVRRQIKRLGLNIPLRDIGRDALALEELLQGGQKDQVPCLRITDSHGVKWLYESSEINQYLAARFAH